MTSIDIVVPDDATPGQHGVYVLRDGNDEVLYIGQTQNLYSRLLQHRKTQPWWRDVRSLEWSPCAGYDEARTAEKSLIAMFRPAANVNDARELPHQSLQTLPEWCAAKLVDLREQESAQPRGDWSARDRLDAYILALRDAGWRLEPIGLALSMTRERVRQRQLRATYTERTFGIPTPPAKPVKPKAAPRPRIPQAVLIEMRELQVLARKVRGLTPADSPNRVASVRFSEMIAEQHIAGVSMYRISQQLGVTPLAIRARLARHGYVEEVKGLPQKPYGTPHARANQETCIRGHSLTDPTNARYINGDPHHRQCRACARIRSREYAERKRNFPQTA